VCVVYLICTAVRKHILCLVSLGLYVQVDFDMCINISTPQFLAQEEDRRINKNESTDGKLTATINVKGFVCRSSKHMERQSIHQFQSIPNLFHTKNADIIYLEC
jgi:hypothetical protein